MYSYIDDQSFVAATVLYRLALEKLPTVSAHSVMGSCSVQWRPLYLAFFQQYNYID